LIFNINAPTKLSVGAFLRKLEKICLKIYTKTTKKSIRAVDFFVYMFYYSNEYFSQIIFMKELSI